jgi:Protein of unknown function (DUF4019)
MCRISATTQSASFKIRLVTLVSIACLVVGCVSVGKNKETAEHGVEVFHSQLDSERYSEMYAEADEGFKKATSQADLEKFLRAVHQKLGKVETANQTSWLMNTSSDGAFVTLTYDTQFSDGKATEQFVWHVTDGSAALFNYNISSAELVTR